ncbi:MAG: hypothetical protein WD005_04740 [Haliea sp.]
MLSYRVYPSFSNYCRVLTAALSLLLLPLPGVSQQSGTPEPVDSWLEIVRQTPYSASQGVAANLATIRRWVLLGDSYCNEPQRHILFDRRGRFLAYIEDAENAETTNDRLNEARKRQAIAQQVDYWSPGSSSSFGYPFALSCHQPFADMDEAIARMVGTDEDYRLWGSWDGMRVGDAASQVALVTMIREVYEHRREQGRFSFPDSVMPSFLGKTMIESGGQKHALSAQAARGIMQLRPGVLDDCEIPEEFRLHRMAQVDCALRLIEQNHRNLEAPFNELFGKLPEDKRRVLYGLLLTQAYQIGLGRTIELLQDEELGRAAAYFAANSDRFSAEDIQVGMIYHNLGRRDIGLRTLYYVTDTRLAGEALCVSSVLQNDAWCETGSE